MEKEDRIPKYHALRICNSAEARTERVSVDLGSPASLARDPGILFPSPWQVLTIENGRGIGPNDFDLMRKRLEDQGVQQIASVSIHGE